MPGGISFPRLPPRDQEPRNERAVRALCLRAESEELVSACMDDIRCFVFVQRAAIRSMADLLMLGFGEVARVRRTSREIAGLGVRCCDHI